MNRLLPLLLLLAGCSRNPSRRLSWRESWELVGITEEGALLDARLSLGNTGLLRGEGHLVLELAWPRATPLLFHRKLPPQAVRRRPGRIEALGNRLEAGRGRWSLQVREGEPFLDATLHLEAPAATLSVPPTTLVEGQRQWSLGVPLALGSLSGAWRSGERSGLFRGTGAALRRAGDRWPGEGGSRLSLYAARPGLFLGVEALGNRALCWLATPGGLRVGHSLSLRRHRRRVLLDLGPELPVRVSFRLPRRRVEVDPWELLPFESWLAELLWTRPVRRLLPLRARVELEGEVLKLRAGLLLVGEPPPLELPRARRRPARREGAGGGL